jgi:hypothetical protein
VRRLIISINILPEAAPAVCQFSGTISATIFEQWMIDEDKASRLIMVIFCQLSPISQQIEEKTMT